MCQRAKTVVITSGTSLYGKQGFTHTDCHYVAPTVHLLTVIDPGPTFLTTFSPYFFQWLRFRPVLLVGAPLLSRGRFFVLGSAGIAFPAVFCVQSVEPFFTHVWHHTAMRMRSECKGPFPHLVELAHRGYYCCSTPAPDRPILKRVSDRLTTMEFTVSALFSSLLLASGGPSFSHDFPTLMLEAAPIS